MKTELKHTPGPWHEGAGNGKGFIFGPEGTRRDSSGLLSICQIYGLDREDKANVRLIAAAPELLEACQITHDWMEENVATPHQRALLHQLQAALAKATGGGE